MRDKRQVIEEPCEAKVSRTVLETSGSREGLAEFNATGKTQKRDRTESATIDSNFLLPSEDPLRSTRPTDECSIYFSLIGTAQSFQSFKSFQILKKLPPWKR